MKTGILRKVLVFSITASLTFSMFGCGKDETAATGSSTAAVSSTTPGQSQSTDLSQKPAVTLKILWGDESAANDKIKYLPDNLIYQEICKKTNVNLEIVGASEEKLRMWAAAGDLPDILQVKDDMLKQLVKSKQVIALDDLLATNGKDITSYVPYRLEYARTRSGADDNKVYNLMPKARGPEVEPQFPATMDVYPYIRWDYYKELGYPSIKSFDDLLNVLKQMVEKHPTTADGKKAYGLSMFNDWNDLWFYQYLTGPVIGNYNGPLTAGYSIDYTNNSLINNYLDPNGAIWTSAKVLNKAYKMGILHPDAFTMKNADYEAAALNGEILFSPAVYMVQKANSELIKQGAGFMAVPFDFGTVYGGSVTGQTRFPAYKGSPGQTKNIVISSNCKTPDRAMDLLNFCYSKEGSRLLTSGIKGVHWDIIDGKPAMKPEIIAKKIAGTEEWKKTCLGTLDILIGCDSPVMLPDGGPVNLINIPSSYKLQNDAVQKDFCDYYKVDYPYETFVKKVEEGKIKENKTVITGSLPVQPDDIAHINTKLLDIMTKALPKCVMEPKTDAEFTAAMNKVMDELREEGAEKAFEWAKQEYIKDRNQKYIDFGGTPPND